MLLNSFCKINLNPLTIWNEVDRLDYRSPLDKSKRVYNQQANKEINK